ncbi:MAG: hypothetical protein HKN13_09385, partial [Rhodothermales bacterium]|nr:hypothetical protein [Rhodothermales bacterium]
MANARASVDGVTTSQQAVVKSAALIRVDTAADNLTSGDGACTLREAITNANANSDSTGGDCAAGSNSGADTIEFQIDGGGSYQVIALGTQGLPDISDAVVIDGFSQGCSSGPCIELDLRNLTTATSGLKIIGSSSIIQGLVINRYSECCEDISGIVISGASATSNQILGNHILGNTESGVVISGGASGNTIGSTAEGQGNLISGNAPNGITIRDAATVNNTIQGNLIGTDIDGGTAVPNEEDGINILDASRMVIGPGNLISGNVEAGVQIAGSSSVENEIAGNKIGTNLDGTARIPNQDGVYLLSGTSQNTVGGKSEVKRNVISGNNENGVNISGSSDNEIFRNFVGTQANGGTPLGNLKSGVSVVGLRNLIGSTEGGTGNIISGNGQHGVRISATTSTGNLIAGNHIGADAFGTSAAPNDGNGVLIEVGVSGNTVGGSRNIISANGGHGVAILGNDNVVQGNIIGADISHAGNLGNGGNGVL